MKQLRADRARLSVQYPDPLRGAILDALNRVLTDPNDLVIASSGSGRLPPRALAIPTRAGWQVKSVAPGRRILQNRPPPIEAAWTFL